MTLSDISIKRPVFAWMLMLGLMVFGFISFQRLGVSLLPNVDFPVVSISLTWEGAAPEVMETDVVDQIEDAVISVQGVRSISSSVRQGTASVTVEMELERDIDVAVQEIQTKLSQAQRRLPEDMDPPTVSKSNPEDQPIIWITATTQNLPQRDLMDYVQNHLKDRFSSINGVGEIFLGGYIERNLRVWVDAGKLQENQMTVQDVISAIQAGHSEMPAGRIETEESEQNVRSMGEALNTKEFENIIIARRGGQPVYKPIYLKDIARIEDGLADIRRISRTNGQTSVGIGVRKQRGFNEVALAKKVIERLEEVKKDLPEDVQLTLTINRTRFIEDSIKELNSTLVLSALVTSLVCWLFLGSFSATFNILLAIPTSILGTFIFIYFLGFTLNTFTMMALSLSIGIVVDDAIMVLENIVRYREKGMGRIEAARIGARQITFAATATTAAIIAIFLPVAFMSGVMGKFFFVFGVTISIAVALSLLEALTLTPMRCSQFLSVGERTTSFGKGIEKAFQRLAESYHGSLAKVLRFRRWVVVAAMLMFVGSLWLGALLKKEFVPPQDQSMFFCRIQTPAGSSIEYTDKKFKEIEAFIMKRPEVANYFGAVGGFGGGEVNSGQIFVTLKDRKDRPIMDPFKKHPSQADLMAFFRKELNKIQGAKVIIQDPSLSGFSSQRGFPIEMTLLGSEWDQLTELSKTLTAKLTESGLMVDVDTNYKEGAAEIRVVPDRDKASARGVSIEQIGQTINAMIAGERVAKYTQGGRRYDVRLRLIPSQRTRTEDIQNLWLWNNFGELVQLKDVVHIEEKPTTQTITRLNRERAITIFANVAPGKSQSDALAAATKIAEENLPKGYHVAFTGSTQTFKESFQSLFFVLWLGILVAYMVLASQFNSYLDPITVLVALPFSISGALLALWLTGQSLNIYSFIGILLLMGITKKNSILLVDFTNQLRGEGLAVDEAILKASPIRLRPILMTSMATIAAAVPPALALGAGSEAFRPMATAVIGGILLSTFLTLFVIPCVYRLFVRLERRKFTPEESDTI